MKVALVASGQEMLGVEYLSKVLKNNGHEIRLFFDPQTFGGSIFLKIDYLQNKFDLSEKIVAGVIKYKPDIVGFSCMTHNYQWSLRIAERIKQTNNIPIIFGGIHPTSVPENVLANSCVDMVAVGEGEVSFSELLKNIEDGNKSKDIRGIYFKHNGATIKNPPYPLIEDLDSLPYPDKHIFFDKIPGFKKATYSIITSRGCPFSCSYCCNDLLKKIYEGRYHVRRRSVDNVISELKWAKDNFTISHVSFFDEVFASKSDWLKEFSEKYKREIGLPFVAFYHFKFATEDRIRLLKLAGCYQLIFGMQSVSEQTRKDICNRFHSNEEAKSAMNLCKKYGIIVHCDHIFGLPFENEDDQAKAVEFYRDVKPDMIYTYWLTYYPATSIIEKGREAGLIKDKDIQLILDGEQSYLHGGIAIKDRKAMLKYQLLFDLIPFLPNRIHRWISRNKWILAVVPKGYIPHFILNFTNRFKLRMPVFTQFFAVALSKKYVP